MFCRTAKLEITRMFARELKIIKLLNARSNNAFNVFREEWDWLKGLSRHKSDNEDDSEEGKTELNNKVEEFEPSEQQRAFARLVAATAKRLLNYMEVSPDEAFAHR
jgi:hypothetical protein